MKEFGIEITADKKSEFEKMVQENYKSATEFDSQAAKLTTTENKLSETEKTLAAVQEQTKEFKDVDLTALYKTIEDLRAENKKKDDDYKQDISNRDFADLVKSSIQVAKGVNAKAISALLDMKTLKESKNQKADVEAAIKALTEAEDSKMLFGTPEPQQVGTVDAIGTVTKPNANTEEAAMRAVMGLPLTAVEGGSK